MRRVWIFILLLGLMLSAPLRLTSAQDSAATPDAGTASASDWPMHRGSAARNGAVPGTGPVGDPVLLWQLHLPGPATRAPAIVAGVAYLGAGDGVLYAVDAMTGEERWHVAVENLGDSTPTVVDGVVYVGSLDGILHALDAATGEERWQVADELSADSTPLVVHGALYVGSEAGHLLALDAATGDEQWRYEAGNAVLRSPSSADGIIYAGTETGLLFALDAATHEKLWEFQGDPEELVGTTGVANGTVYFHQAKMMWALDARTGEVRWMRDINEGGVRCADPFEDLIVTCGASGQVTGLDAATGDVRWTFMTGDNNQPGALVDGVLYVASFDRNIYAIDAATGEERWHFPIDGEVSYGPHVANGVVYAGTDLGSVYAIGGSDTFGTASVTPAATPVASPTLDLVVIGDSIPFAGFCTTCEQAFVDDYAMRLEDARGREVNVINRSRNDGAQLNQIADQVATEATLREQLASAEMVIISAGINDGPTWTAEHSCGSDTGTTVREAVDQILAYTPDCLDAEVAAREEDFRRLFTSVDDLVPDASPVVVVNAYNWWTGWQDLAANATPAELTQIDESITYFLDGWNTQECALAAESGFMCIDLYHAFNGPDGMSPAGDLLELDYSHPSKQGNALIADLLMAANLVGS